MSLPHGISRLRRKRRFTFAQDNTDTLSIKIITRKFDIFNPFYEKIKTCGCQFLQPQYVVVPVCQLLFFDGCGWQNPYLSLFKKPPADYPRAALRLNFKVHRTGKSVEIAAAGSECKLVSVFGENGT